MRYQVPQFTDVEDKIVGPLSLKQFIYLAGAVGLCVVFYSILPLPIAVFFMLPTILFGVALAFYKVNNKPFIQTVEAAFKYILASKLYIWKHEPKMVSRKDDGGGLSATTYVPKLSDSKLKDLTWSLDVNENLNPVTKNENR
jgi:hypothetical protein